MMEGDNVTVVFIRGRVTVLGKIQAKKRPNLYRQRELDYILHDYSVMRVYCDASSSPEDASTFGVAANFVHDGECILRVHKGYRRNIVSGYIQYAELYAVYHAVSMLNARLRAAKTKPRRVVVYSDMRVIEEFLKGNIGAHEHKDLVIYIQSGMMQIKTLWPTIKFSIEYIDCESKYNPFYGAAHHAARKAVRH